MKAAAISLAVVGQLLAVAHMGFVHHEVCAEHGELVEMAAAAKHLDIHVAGLHARASDAGCDDHCGAATLTRSTGATPATLLVSPVQQVVDTITVDPPELAFVTAAAVLDYAPKQGPPC